MRPRRALAVGTLVVAAVAGAVATVGIATGDSSEPSETVQSAPTGERVPVQRGDLVTDAEFVGTASYGDEWSPPAPSERDGDGIITWAPDPGTIVKPGEVVLRIDDQPVFLAQGDTPMYRRLERVSPNLEGDDVLQLQRFLAWFGYDVEPDGTFGWETERALEAWQEDNGLDDTGAIDREHMWFVPGPVRVASDLRVGTTFESIELTDSSAVVTVDTTNRDRAALSVGDDVEIVLADGSTVGGVIVSQHQVNDDDGNRVWRTSIEPTGELPSDAAAVDVRVIDERASDVLLVPVRALIAVAEGGYAVDVVQPDGSSRLVPVDVGAVVDGRAEISGPIAEGDELVVPR